MQHWSDETQSIYQQKWCAVCGTVVTSLVVVALGIFSIAKEHTAAGYPLTVVGGVCLLLGLLSISGRFRRPKAKVEPPPWSFSDPPPAYRLSWRRDFFQQQQTRSSLERLNPLPQVPGVGGNELICIHCNPTRTCTSPSPLITSTDVGHIIPAEAVKSTHLTDPLSRSEQIPAIPESPVNSISSHRICTDCKRFKYLPGEIWDVEDPPTYETAMAALRVEQTRDVKELVPEEDLVV